MPIDESLVSHNADYDPPDAWKQYTDEELRWWVHLLTKRAGMRVPGEKKTKDLVDAVNYQAMLDSRKGS